MITKTRFEKKKFKSLYRKALQFPINVIYSLLYVLFGFLEILFDQSWANHFEHTSSFLKPVQFLGQEIKMQCYC